MKHWFYHFCAGIGATCLALIVGVLLATAVMYVWFPRPDCVPAGFISEMSEDVE